MKIVRINKTPETGDSNDGKFRLPKAEGKLEYFIITIDKRSPIDFYSIGGVHFQKNVLPVKSSLEENEGKVFEQNYFSYPLAENQYKALKKILESKTLHVPARFNPEYSEDSEASAYLPEENILLSNHLKVIPENEASSYFIKLEKEEI